MNNKITVTSAGITTNVNVTPDSAMYYSNKAREWAISDRIVDGVDYSSKYYAGKANESATSAQTSATNASETYTQLQATASQALEDIGSAEETSITNINTVKDDSLTEIETAKTTAVNTVNTSKNEALNAIETESGSIINFKDEVNAELENKVDVDDMVAFDMKEVPCITETYVNGLSWYRIYSDGWCEQGGISTTSDYTLTFIKQFKKMPNIIATKYTSATSSAGSYGTRIVGLTLTGCTIKFDSYTADVNGYCGSWQACGYIA